MNRILAYGEILWDIFPGRTILGGAPFNFAYRIKSLGDTTLFASRIGTDELGDRAYAHMRTLGMDTALLQRNTSLPTGTVSVRLTHNQAPDYVINPNTAYDYIELTDELLNAAAQTECLCFGTLIQRTSKSRQTLQALIDAATNAVKFLDINLRKNCWSKETIHYSLTRANILKLNDDEVEQLRDIFNLRFQSYPRFCQLMLNMFELDYILITFGEYGAMAQSALGEEVYVPGYKIKVIDSLGAGDAFSAGFIHHLLKGRSLRHACENGNALGALVAATLGGTSPVSENELISLLGENTQRTYHPDFR